MSDAAPAPKRRRLPAAERSALLVAKAAEVFAEQGFTIPTRDIAQACGVTQALLYKYFGSKDALIEAVLEARFLSERGAPDTGPLATDAPLAERIADFYLGFLAAGSETNLRLFLRAALDGLDLPARYGARLDARILKPVIDTVKRAHGLTVADRALTRGEREIAMMLHGCAVFLMIRRVIYRTPFPRGYAPELRRHVRVWLAGAPAELARER